MTLAKRVLVTGANGFIGRHTLPELLKRNYDVHAVIRDPTFELPIGVVPHSVNLLAGEDVERLIEAVRPTHLLHLAWDVTPGKFWTARENLDWVAASLKLYGAFAAAGGRRAAFGGSCAEYDWRYDRLDERVTPLNPGTLYGTAKTALHRIIESAAEQDDISIAWGRIFFVYGPHEASVRLVPDVMLSLLQNRPALCGEGKIERDFMHVADVARALVLMLDSDYRGPVNIASGVCLPLREIIWTIAGLIGRRDLVRLGARPTPVAEAPRLAAATSILNEQIGFKPVYGLKDGLTDTLEWWRDRVPVADTPMKAGPEVQ